MNEFSKVFGGYTDSVSGLIGFSLRYPQKTPALNLAFIKQELKTSPNVYFDVQETTNDDGSINVRINYRYGNFGLNTTTLTLKP